MSAIPGPDATREEVDRFREEQLQKPRARRVGAATMRPCVVCGRLIKVRNVNGTGPRCAKHKAGAT